MSRQRASVWSRVLSSIAVAVRMVLLAMPVSAAEPDDAEGRKRMSERIGERISRGVVQESLEALDEPENRDRLGRILNSPQMRAAMHDLTASIVVGVVDGLASTDLKNLDVAAGIGKGMDAHLTPAMGRLTHRIVDSALTASLADKHIGQVEKLAEASTHAAIAGLASGLEQELGPALAKTLDRDLGPAIATLIERDVMPAVGRGLTSPEMQGAIAQVTRSIATELVSGTDEAIEAVTQKDGNEAATSGLQIFGSSVAMGYAVAVFFAFALGTMFIVMTVLLVRSNRRQRRTQEQTLRRERALLHLLEQLESKRPDVRGELDALLRDDDDAAAPA